VNPSFSASERAMVLLPAPAGPSIAMMIGFRAVVPINPPFLYHEFDARRAGVTGQNEGQNQVLVWENISMARLAASVGAARAKRPVWTVPNGIENASINGPESVTSGRWTTPNL
jgi:hypothetical protein